MFPPFLFSLLTFYSLPILWNDILKKWIFKEEKKKKRLNFLALFYIYRLDFFFKQPFPQRNVSLITDIWYVSFMGYFLFSTCFKGLLEIQDLINILKAGKPPQLFLLRVMTTFWYGETAIGKFDNFDSR